MSHSLVDRVPDVLVGLGLLLAGVMVVEVVGLVLSPVGFVIVNVANWATSVPFVAILLGGGYWLSQSSIRSARYPRIVAWTVAGLAFLGTFFTIIATVTPGGLLVRVGILRWGAAAGAGSGALVGIFEARAIDRAVRAERTRVRNEKLQRENDRLEKFAGILSHDLRNPLNVATGYVGMLKDEYDDGQFERVVKAHARMEQIIEETLLLARSGKTVDETEAVALADIVDRCWRNVDTKAANLEVERSGTITADPERVRRLFENLFRNAIEHGGADVTIRVGTLPEGFYVEDDGPGIPADRREAVFEFGHSTAEEGTGFGLAIVREIAEAHGWDVQVTDGTDGGARFEVTGVEVVQPATDEGTTSVALA